MYRQARASRVIASSLFVAALASAVMTCSQDKLPLGLSVAAATKLAISVQPGTATAGTAIAPAVQVTVQDAQGNTVTTATTSVTIAITGGTGTTGAVLGGTLTQAAVSGVATFGDLTIDKAGTGYTLTATATGLTAAATTAFAVNPGAPAKVVFTVQPSAVTAGAAIAPAVQVTVQDALGNKVTTATNSITLSISSGTGTAGAVLSGTLTQAAASGVATFNNLSIDKSGAGYTLSAAGIGLTTTASAGFTVNPGAPAKLVFSVQPTTVTAGVAIAPAVQVTLQDALGNKATSATNGVSLAITGGTGTTGAVLSGTLTQAAVAGVATFGNLTIDKVGTGYTLSGTATGLTGATSSAFAVNVGAPAKLAFTVQPSTVTSGAAIAPAVQVTVQDGQGNTVPTATNSVTLAITSGTGTTGATLGGTLTQAAVAGLATFSNLTIDKAGTGYTLSATATGLAGSASSAFAVNFGAASKLAFTVQPSAVVAGVAIAPAVRVSVQDAQGNTVTSASTGVTVAITSGTGTAGATLGGTLTQAAASGVATFNNLTVDKAGSGYTLTASGSGVSSTASSGFNTTPAAASVAVSTVTASSATVASGSGVTLTLQAKDAFGNNLTAGGLTVVFTASGGTSTGTIGATTDNGNGTYTATFTGVLAGTATTIGATIGGVAVTTAMPTVQVTVGGISAGRSVVSVSAGTVVSGSAVTLTLQAKDAAGNNITSGGATVVFAASGGTSTGTVGATTDHGDGTYTATFTGVLAGTATTIGATIGGTAVTTTLPTVQVTVGPVSTAGSVVTVSNGTTASGSAVTLTLRARDAAGNNLASGGLTVVFSASGGTSTGTIGATTDNGNGTYTASFTGIVAGTATTIGATIGGSAVTSTLPTVTVTPGPVSTAQSVVSVSSGSVAVGSVVTLTLQAKDQAGNNLTAGGLAVVFTASGGTSAGTIGATTDHANGTYTATFTGTTAGTATTIGATIGGTAVTSTLPNLQVTVGGISTSQSVVTVSSGTVVSGSGVTLTLQAKDAAGTNITTGGAAVVFTASGGTSTGTIGATTDHGNGTYTATFTGVLAGTATTIGATIGGSPVTSTLPTVAVTVGPISTTGSVVTVSNPTVASGSAVTLTLQAKDAAGNNVTSGGATVVFTAAGGTSTGTVGGTTDHGNGSYTASFTGVVAGTATTIGATINASAVTSTLPTVAVTPGPANKLILTTPAAGALSGAAFTTQPIVAVRDVAGNTVTSDNSTVVTMAVSAGGTVVGTASATASSGVATFATVGISGPAGNYSLTFTSAPVLTAATQATIALTAGNATQLVLTTPAAGAASGAAFTTQPVVAVRDAQGNTVTSDNATVVTMSVNLGATTVGTASATASSGVATFATVGISGTAGSSYTLTFGSGTLTSATQSITPVHGAATQLALTTAASGAPAGAAFTTQPVVTVRDGAGNTVTSDNSTVVTMTVNAGATTVPATATATAAGGVATFSGVGITGTAGTAYTLTYAAGTLTSATQSITPVFGPATKLTLTTQAAGAVSGAAFTTQPVVAVRDAGNNLVTNDNSTVVTMAVGGGAGTVGTVTATASGGVATFANVGITGTAGTPYTLTFASGTLTSATESITPTAGAPAQLVLTTSAAGASSGHAFTTQPVVAVRDAQGNLVTTDNATVVTMSVGGGGGVVGTATATASGGVATFVNVGITGTAGTPYTLTFASGTLTSATQSITPTPGTASQLVLTTAAAGAPSGAAFTTQPVVAVRDAQGNTVTSDNSTLVTMTVSGGATTVPATATATAVAGVATFSGVGITGSAGTGYTLTFASGTLTSATQPITAAIGPSAKLTLATLASGAASGAAFTTQPVVHVLDSGNNLATGDNSSVVTMTVSVGGSLVGTATATASGGVATFTNVGISGLVNTYTLTFSSNPLTGTTQTIALTAGVGTQWTIETQPGGAASRVVLTSQPKLQLRDGAGNPVPQLGVGVTAAIASGGGTLGGTTTIATNGAGVAAFTDLVITGTVGSRMLSFTSSLPTVTSAAFNLTPGPATQLILTTAAAGAASGAAFTTQPVVAVQDADGNTETADNATQVTMAVGAGASVTGTPTVTVASGVAIFSGTGLTGTIGTYNLTFTSSPVRTPATENGLALVLGAATKLVLTTPAAGAENGAAFATQPIVQVQDAGSNLETTDGTTQVTMTVTSGATIVGTATATASGGIATFSTVGITGTPGTPYTLTFASGPLTSATQSITAALGLATHLTLTQSAAGAASGAAFTTQPKVEVRDAGNFLETGDNSTVVTMTVSGSATTVPVTATATAVGGVATFSGVGISGLVGPYTLTFASGSLTAATQPITLTFGAPTHFTFTTQPAGAASGVAFTTQPVLQLRDASENAVSQGGVTVTASIASGGPALGGTTSIITNGAGVAAFTNLMITGTIGDRTLSFASTFPTVTSNTVTLTPGPASQLILTTPAGGAASGSPFTTEPVVTVEDAQNNIATAYSGSVTLAISGGTGNPPGVVGANPVTVVNGVANFGTANTTGVTGGNGQTYTLTYTSGALTLVTQSITVTTGVGTQLQFVQQPSGSVQNAIQFPQQPALRLRDSYGNLVLQSGVIVTAALNSGAPALGGTLTATTDGTGTATFTDLVITGLIGDRTLKFTSNIPGAVTLVSNTVTVTPGVATQLFLTTLASGAASSAAFTGQPVVTVQDVSGNTVTSDASTVTMTIDGGAATVPVPATAPVVSGVAHFIGVGVSGTVGSYTLTYTDGTLTQATQPIGITPGAAAQLILHTAAAGATNGLPFSTQPVIYVEDAQNNLRTNDNATQVTMSVSAGATRTGATTVTASGGIATFANAGINGTISTNYTLTFSSGVLPSVDETNVQTALGAATHLVLTQPAGGAASGAAFTQQPILEVRDAGNNLETGDGSTQVTMAVSAGGTIVGTNPVTASGGVVTFTDIGIAGLVGSYNLVFSAPSLASAPQAGLALAHGIAAKLLLTQVAAGAASGAAFTQQPSVTVQDAQGNTVTNDVSTVTMTVNGGASTVPLTAQATAIGGIATFSGVGISGTVGTYTLTYQDGALTTTSQSIGLAAGVGTQFTIEIQPGGAASGSLLSPQPVLQLRDAALNPVAQAGVDVTVSVASGSGAITSGALTAHTDVNGVATFTGLVITGADTYTLLFTSSLLANPTVTSDPFTVTP